MIEIERKFLVKGDFIPYAARKERIVQAYLCTDIERCVRVRIKGESAFVTIKGPADGKGFSHAEFEYPIPREDAAEIMKLCKVIIEKDRYYVPVGKHTFEVDVFYRMHEGLIIAELELQSEQESFEKPDWIGEEVTGNNRYYNIYLANHPYKKIVNQLQKADYLK